MLVSRSDLDLDSRLSVATDIPLACSVAFGPKYSQCTTASNFVKVCHHPDHADLDQPFSNLMPQFRSMRNSQATWRNAAEKNKDVPKGPGTLIGKMKRDDRGVWNPIPMTPNNPSDDDLKIRLECTLSLKRELTPEDYAGAALLSCSGAATVADAPAAGTCPFVARYRGWRGKARRRGHRRRLRTQPPKRVFRLSKPAW